MAKTAPWYSVSTAFTMGESSVGGEDVVGGDKRVYHDDDACEAGKAIPPERRAPGKGEPEELPRCLMCAGLDRPTAGSARG